MILAIAPINIACGILTKPAAGVIATKPTTTPIQAPIADNLCPSILSRKTHAIPAAGFVANEKTAVNVKLQDVFHTFKKGHKIQVQVQSTWFPLIDLNPQTFVENIFYAKPEDFQKQTHKVFNDSKIEFTILK